MRLTASQFLSILASFGLACAGSEPDTTDVTGSSATDATESNATEEASDGVVQPPWSDTSTHLAVSIKPAFAVSSRFEASRAQLREEQLQALRGLRLDENPSNPLLCGDCDGYQLTITDADGSVAHYENAEYANADPPIDGVIDLSSLQPFLDTFDCFASGTNPFGGRDGAAQSWGGAPILSTADVGCYHGILHYACDDMRFWLAVEEPGQYQISSVDCAPDLTVELMTRDLTALASAASTSAECPVITHEFAEAGSYALMLHRDDNAACDQPRGQVYYQLRVTASEP